MWDTLLSLLIKKKQKRYQTRVIHSEVVGRLKWARLFFALRFFSFLGLFQTCRMARLILRGGLHCQASSTEDTRCKFATRRSATLARSSSLHTTSAAGRTNTSVTAADCRGSHRPPTAATATASLDFELN